MVEVDATIGANATILCGVTIGRYARICVGSVVTRDMTPFTQVVGNPARKIGWGSHVDERLDDGLVCRRKGECYRYCGLGVGLNS